MATAEERDWVDVANDLLRSCHIYKHVKHLSECGAYMFVLLYESILGEEVPDFIATPRSQEDDAHNVQAVIDSLALDYLQVSLSHITGENIVKGERESIRNLLEIFDGLLEYLTEEASQSSSQNGGSTESVHTTEPQKKSLKASATELGEPIQQAIPLRPPFQPSEARCHYPGWRDYHSSASQSTALASSQGVKIPMVKFTTKCILQEFVAYICLYLVVKVRDDDLLFQLLEEFPHLHISHHTMNKLWRRQLAHTEQLKAASGRTRPQLQNEVQQALKKHELLLAIIKKDQDHNKRLQEFKQRICRQKWAQSKVREKRQQIARARKYYEDYRVQLRAKMMRARTQEERIFKNLFQEGLEIQKRRLKDLRAYAQEKRAEQRREHQNELESMENYYKDQFSMLAEALSQERQEIQTREKAQAQMLQKTKRELRSRMEQEIEQLQTAIMQNDDDTFFQELEADRLKSRLQMASFQYSKSHFL
uniref:Centrosomal protein 95 n=1 Tax=Calidris pygmaea TaxID=425635 RepID=A0A8C3KD93_9CHAR